jgi:hypothetical protein
MFQLQTARRNLIYHFYEEWNVNSEGNLGKEGDKHYRCHHGARRIFTISKASNYNLHSKLSLLASYSILSFKNLPAMINHIEILFKAMHDLFIVMKTRESPTADEILMASGKKIFDDSLKADYLKIIEDQAVGIQKAFATQ